MMEARLSEREFEIAEKIALGASKKEVANKINRSTYTVETTIKNVYDKLGINKLSDLVLWYCGCVFDISDAIDARKKQILATALILIVCMHGYEANMRRIRQPRRQQDVEYSLQIKYTPESV